MITFPQVNLKKFLTSSSLPVMKIALIIEKPEVGGVLPSLAAEGAAPWCSPEPSYISHGSSSFPSARSQHCFHFKSCKIIPVLHFAFSGNIPQRPACTWLKRIKTGMCVQQKKKKRCQDRVIKDEKQLYWQLSGCLCDPNSRAANQIALLRVIRLQWKLVSQLLGWVVLGWKITQAPPADNDCFRPDSE